ncbi:hypothetical protein ACR3K2_04210 [Cryptosporidium serpentis]
MSDRKLLNRYYPPDFDPEKLEAGKKVLRAAKKSKNGKKRKMLNIRMLYPFTVRCNGCGDYLYVGTKFNSKVEKVPNEDYLGIPIWRFHGRCTQCGNVIVFRTNPKNGDYELESGGKRNFDPKRDEELAAKSAREILEEELLLNKDKALQRKVLDTAEEIQTQDLLEELRRINKRLMNRDEMEKEALQLLDKERSTLLCQFLGDEVQSSQIRQKLQEEEDFELQRNKWSAHTESKLLKVNDELLYNNTPFTEKGDPNLYAGNEVVMEYIEIKRDCDLFKGYSSEEE